MAKQDYIKQGDGVADITLTRAIKIDGADVAVVRMREPKVRDQLLMGAMEGSDADKELAVMANLCTISAADLHEMGLRDYKRLQEAFALFIV
jgi:hypothetical protein